VDVELFGFIMLDESLSAGAVSLATDSACSSNLNFAIVQPRAKGIEMWEYKNFGNKEYLAKRSGTFANAPQGHFDKFVADFKEIVNAGLLIDVCGSENFFYDKQNGFSFIDFDSIMSAEEKQQQSELLHKHCTLPAFRTLIQDKFAECEMSEDEFSQFILNNMATFIKCKRAIVKNGIATEENIELYLQNAKEAEKQFPVDDVTALFDDPNAIHVAGITGSFEIGKTLIQKAPREKDDYLKA